MKIAISAHGDNLGAKAHSQFGRCDYFVIVDMDTGETHALHNKSAEAGVAIHLAPSGISVQEVLEKFKAGSLPEMQVQRF